jgi:hypothetical protein
MSRLVRADRREGEAWVDVLPVSTVQHVREPPIGWSEGVLEVFVRAGGVLRARSSFDDAPIYHVTTQCSAPEMERSAKP